MAADAELLARYEELLEAYESAHTQLAEAHTSLENLKWGFQQREASLTGQLQQYQAMAVKLHSSNAKLREDLRVVCEKMCDDLETAERVVEQDRRDTDGGDNDRDPALLLTDDDDDGPAESTAALKQRIAELEAALAAVQASPSPRRATKTPTSPPKSPSPMRVSTATHTSPRAPARTYGGLSSGSSRTGPSPSSVPPHLLPPAGLTSAQVP